MTLPHCAPAASQTSSAELEKLNQTDVLRKVCEDSLMRGTKRKIQLVPCDSWMPEFMSWQELDGDAYSRNGHPPKKLILNRSSKEMEIRSWNRTPCRYGEQCSAKKRGSCWFMHTNCKDDVEVAAGSALRLRQIKHAFERTHDGEQKHVAMAQPKKPNPPLQL